LAITTPFLKLDLKIIVNSISKVLQFFGSKLGENEKVKEKSQTLVKTVEH
jgi:hypothetical protein